MYLNSELSDDELIELLKEGQEQALSTLYFRYWKKLLVVAKNRLNNLEIAEECVQNVFFSIWERRNELKIAHSFASYLSVAVKYQVIKEMDKKYRKQVGKSLNLDQAYSYPSADQSLLEKELMERIEDATNRLPEKCRIVFKMSREQGMTNKQIAADLNISEKTVEAHITKAIKDLRKDLLAISPFILLLFFTNSK